MCGCGRGCECVDVDMGVGVSASAGVSVSVWMSVHVDGGEFMCLRVCAHGWMWGGYIRVCVSTWVCVGVYMYVRVCARVWVRAGVFRCGCVWVCECVWVPISSVCTTTVVKTSLTCQHLRSVERDMSNAFGVIIVNLE